MESIRYCKFIMLKPYRSGSWLAPIIPYGIYHIYIISHAPREGMSFRFSNSAICELGLQSGTRAKKFSTSNLPENPRPWSWTLLHLRNPIVYFPILISKHMQEASYIRTATKYIIYSYVSQNISSSIWTDSYSCDPIQILKNIKHHSKA